MSKQTHKKLAKQVKRMRSFVTQVYRDNPKQILNYKQIASKIGLDDAVQKQIEVKDTLKGLMGGKKAKAAYAAAGNHFVVTIKGTYRYTCTYTYSYKCTYAYTGKHMVVTITDASGETVQYLLTADGIIKKLGAAGYTPKYFQYKEVRSQSTRTMMLQCFATCFLTSGTWYRSLHRTGSCSFGPSPSRSSTTC